MLESIWEWLKNNWLLLVAIWALWKIEMYARITAQTAETIAKRLEDLQSDLGPLCDEALERRRRIPPELWSPSEADSDQ